MSPPQASLDQMYGIYKTLKRSQKQQLRSLLKSGIDEITFFDPLLYSTRRGEPLSQEELNLLKTDLASKVEEELSDYFFVAMVATFERFVLNYILGQLTIEIESPNPFREELNQYLDRNIIGRARFEDVIDLFKPIVDPHEPNLIGLLKQAYRYRNWVAHGKRTSRPEGLRDLNDLHVYLSRFIQVVGI